MVTVTASFFLFDRGGRKRIASVLLTVGTDGRPGAVFAYGHVLSVHWRTRQPNNQAVVGNFQREI